MAIPTNTFDFVADAGLFGFGVREIRRDDKGVEEREIELIENAGMSKFTCVEVICEFVLRDLEALDVVREIKLREKAN